jgi:hypothetical protein
MDADKLVSVVVGGTWDERIAAVRSVPDEFPGREHSAVYAQLAREFYVDRLAPHFHLVPWPERFRDRDGFFAAYSAAQDATNGFLKTDGAAIAAAIESDPRSLRIFRLIIGYRPEELADALDAYGDTVTVSASLSASVIGRLEEGGAPSARTREAFPAVGQLISDIVSGVGGYSVSPELREKGFRGKTDKPDTEAGWKTVAEFAHDGVPYAELLYQRFYCGAFRQVQDAGGALKGEILEGATEALFQDHGVPYVRTVPGTQATAGAPFGITVQPAPDFILHDGSTARGLLECKSAGDGGTARDKAGRFASLRREGERLGGIPVLAVIDGFGWRRVNDALGPVVRDCDGRVFTTGTLLEMLEVEPVRSLTSNAS